MKATEDEMAAVRVMNKADTLIREIEQAMNEASPEFVGRLFQGKSPMPLLYELYALVEAAEGQLARAR